MIQWIPKTCLNLSKTKTSRLLTCATEALLVTVNGIYLVPKFDKNATEILARRSMFTTADDDDTNGAALAEAVRSVAGECPASQLEPRRAHMGTIRIQRRLQSGKRATGSDTATQPCIAKASTQHGMHTVLGLQRAAHGNAQLGSAVRPPRCSYAARMLIPLLLAAQAM